MRDMKKLTPEKLQIKKIEIDNYLNNLLDFYNKISIIEGVDSIFSKEFVTKTTPKGNHNFLISFLIPLTLAYDYLIAKGFFKHQLKEDDYHLVYKAIVRGMMASEFIDFGGVSSTSYKF